MKPRLTLIFILLQSIAFAQLSPNEWEYAAPFGGGKRDDGSAFSANGFGYFGCGIDEYYQLRNDFWRFEPNSNSWSEIDSLPGLPRQYASIFEIEERVFLVGGVTADGVSNEVYEFDGNTETWKKLDNAPFAGVAAAAAFVYRDKGYLVGGRNDSIKINEFWEFDSKSAKWNRMPTPPFEPKDEMSAFSLGNKGFVLLGRTQGNSKTSNVYFFDFIYQIWHEIDSYPGEAAMYCECKSVGGRYAVCAGGESKYGALLNEAYYYDDSTAAFYPLPDLIEPKIRGMQAFLIGSSIYYVGGLTPNFTRTAVTQKLRFEEERMTTKSKVKVFPNPASDWMLIEFLESPNLRVESAYVVNLHHQELRTETIINDGTVHINVSELPAGMYWVMAGLSNHVIQRITIVVK